MNEQFTAEELASLRVACTWASVYWENLNDPEITRENARLVARSYRDLGKKVDEVVNAQKLQLAELQA